MRAPGRTREVVTTRTATRAAIAGAAALVLMASATANPSAAHPAADWPGPVAVDPPVWSLLAERAERALFPPSFRRTVRAPRPAAHRLKPRPRLVAVQHRSAHRWKSKRTVGHRVTRRVLRKASAAARPVRVTGRSAGTLAAVTFALGQRGKRYVFGQAGPNTYDCSGLTMRSFARAGIRLPRRASGQSARGHAVSRRQARAGDLVAWGGAGRAYHVGVYLGGGRVLHSPRSGQRVRVAPLWGAPTFRRLS